MDTLRPRAAEGSREDREAKTRAEAALKKHHYIHLYVIKSNQSKHLGNEAVHIRGLCGLKLIGV